MGTIKGDLELDDLVDIFSKFSGHDMQGDYYIDEKFEGDISLMTYSTMQRRHAFPTPVSCINHTWTEPGRL